MTALPLVLAPHPIFKAKTTPVDKVTDAHRALLDNMLDTLYAEHGVGVAAQMVGELLPLVVIDLQEDAIKAPLYMVNPEIVSKSEEMQTVEEASLSFLGIAAPVTRPKAITVRYLDYNGAQQEMAVEGFLATVIQHEIDYLHGITFVDHQSKMKQDMLVRKMLKFKKHYQPHVHGANCSH